MYNIINLYETIVKLVGYKTIISTYTDHKVEGLVEDEQTKVKYRLLIEEVVNDNN